MRRITPILLSLLSLCSYCYAAEPSRGLLADIDAALAALGCYEVTFEIKTDGCASAGRYVVDGADFYLASDGIEVYVESGVKYQVSSASREIVVDEASSLGNDIISNPARGFVSLAENLSVEEISVDGCRAVRLTPKSGGEVSETITVIAEARQNTPKSIVYSAEGGAITIEVKSLVASQDGLPRFNAEKYRGYEVVDMR